VRQKILEPRVVRYHTDVAGPPVAPTFGRTVTATISAENRNPNTVPRNRLL
jgi:hypothetical protein